MRTLVFIFLITFTSMFSQGNTDRTITVIGETNKKVEIGYYHLSISLKEVVSDGYQQLESKTLSEVIQMYKDRLKTINVDFNAFQKNIPLQLYSSYGEIKDAMCYNYTTTSQEEILNIIKQRMKGLTLVQVETIAKEKSNDQLAILTTAAIEDAKIKAKKIADKLNKKLGDIIKVENSNAGIEYVNVYGLDELQKYQVTVTFTMKQ
ncbi:hypothetical protein [Aquimarina sp. 2201CG5-10]|uniref:hypothetical protein n=1 Tax=Aquimarina callyspongiae TaxID=3098150 RepID=UPI002AB545E9|nr:hypothetical protein [Aquimarina sp. 2201CG5-10]MDY8138528.1 hypothetical protein [Aquimarina sp. 2201CG5-10]